MDGSLIRNPARVQLARGAAGLALGVLWLAAMIVVARRLAGAFTHPPDAILLGATGCAIVLCAVAIRLAGRSSGRTVAPSQVAPLVALALVSGPVLALGAMLSMPGTSLAGLLVLWVMLLGEECWAWSVWARRDSREDVPVARTGTADPAPSPPVPSLSIAVEHPAPDAEIPEEIVLQQLTRSCCADGVDQLSGWLRASWSAGQRTNSVHVAFCPPFAQVPELTIEQRNGPPAFVKVAQRLPYGVRLEMKLTNPSEVAEYALFRFTAVSGRKA